MIDFFAGVITKDADGLEKVERFFPVHLYQPQEIEWFNENTTLNFHTRGRFDVDVETMSTKPTNMIVMVRNLFYISDSTTDRNQLNTLLQGKTINFFEDNTIDSKLNFEMYLMNVNLNNYLEVLFGDIKRGLVMKDAFSANPWQISGSSEKYYRFNTLIINPKYSGSDFTTLMSSVRKFENNLYKNKIFTKYLNCPEYAPLYFYYNDTPKSSTRFNNITGGVYSFEADDTRTLMSMQQGLTNYSNWFTMLTGDFFYGQPFTIKLMDETKGLEEIELCIPVSPQGYDEGREFTSTFKGVTPNIDYDSRGFRFYTVGTDLSYLFDFTKSNEEIVWLESGYLRKYKKSGENGFRFQLRIANKGLEAYLGSGQIQPQADFWTGRDMTCQSIYLGVTPDFAQIPINAWKKEISKNVNKWIWNNCPLFIGSNAANGIQTSFIDYVEENETTQDNQDKIPIDTPVAGLVVNYAWSGSNLPQNFISDELPIDYSFWEDFLDGLSETNVNVNVGGGSIGGGTSGTGGGGGNFNDASFSINSIGNLLSSTVGTIKDTRFLNLYSVDQPALYNIALECWTKDWKDVIGDVQKKVFGNNQNPMDSLVSVKYYPITPSTGTALTGISIAGQSIIIGGGKGNIRPLTNDFQKLSFGTIKLDEYFGSFVDYDETNISIVLPFVGIRQLDTRKMMSGSITLDAYVDYLDSSISYYLSSNKDNVSNVIESWRGQVGFEFPITSQSSLDKSNALFSGVASTLGGAITGGLVGNIPGAIAGGVAGLVGAGANALSTKSTTQTSGNFAGSRFSIVKPYLIIERPKLSTPENFAHLKGYPSNITSKMKYLEGFTVVDQCHLDNMGHATSAELEEIETLLKSGVIF